MIEENLGAYLSDFGVDVVWDGETALGILDMPDTFVGELAVTTDYKLTLRSDSFPNMSQDDDVIVNEIDYKVREIYKIGDGLFVEVLLSAVDI